MPADGSIPARAKSSKATPSLVSPFWRLPDALVVSVIDGEPEQTPGNYPTNIALDKADGNCIILDLGNHRYALYAHMQPGSIKVHSGDKVHLGQVIGLVGDTGNSIVPHLHFQVMDGPSSLSSNGFPYEISEFQVTGETAGGTKAFDEAESNGTPLPSHSGCTAACRQAGHATGPADYLVCGALDLSTPERQSPQLQMTRNKPKDGSTVNVFCHVGPARPFTESAGLTPQPIAGPGSKGTNIANLSISELLLEGGDGQPDNLHIRLFRDRAREAPGTSSSATKTCWRCRVKP